MLDRFAKSWRLALAIAVGSALASHSHAAPSDLDPTFGNNGISRLGYRFLWGDAAYRDGRIALVVGNDHFTPQYSVTPRVVARLDASGNVDASFAPIDSFAGSLIESIAVTVDGRLLTLQSRYAAPDGELTATRHLDDGALDPAFGEAGVAVVSEFAHALTARYIDGQTVQTAMIAGDNGRAYVGIRESTQRGTVQSTWIDRIAASGAPVETLGYVTAPDFRLYQSLLLDDEDRLVALIYRLERTFGGPETSGPALIRFADGVPDRTFGIRGLAYQAVPNWSDGAWSIGSGYDGLAATSDGGYVVVGRISESVSRDVVAVVKFTSQGLLDRSFGDHGIARIRFTSADARALRAVVEVAPDGDIVVAASLAENDLSLIGLARLTPSGRPDDRFAPGGTSSFWTDDGVQAHSLHLQPDGRIVIVGGIHDRPSSGLPTPAVFRFYGGDLARARPLRERIAVEYFHAGYGHYFVTADAHEIFNLDINPASGWARTGKSFAVWDQDDPSLVQACRFWSDQSFAPKSSHVYTSHADECALLKAGSTWRFERNAFALRLPQGPASSECADDARPLYRAYNNAIGGAPNHRYTVDPATLDEMIALGWTAEGAANTRVFACVPLP